ncbi:MULTISPECIES: hypothetical protein [Geobacillus]|uniref:Uncharacterized protein n=1 Tax=Geobacillus subterraneus TaxID=129338 RepID=A0A679FQX5_9BACL|nr:MULTISPECIES: hypothetical protein [Geobacillus]KYD30933.1 hypothetical protein B4113_2783 [Geobacillus sp. B4113_201601]NNV07237.1 hypothetical protein [Geobacillus sp. MMMUD3]TWG30499.1 hypothetical protein GC56T2_1646 [Geobacillus sp. C56-T2]BBW96136.1 hypothetical protein GsuE55_09690 [Geobacillus subterraneus]
MKFIPPARRKRAYLSQFTTTNLHLRHPLVVAFFSFSFPGFGNLMLHRYATAFILIVWELFINTKAHVNAGILYSLLGDFEKAKAVLDERWLMFYVAIYIYGIWDSYRGAVDMNKLYLLADREDAPIPPLRMGGWDINYLDKRKPWLALAWSVLAPGLGHLYVHKVIAGLFLFGFTIIVSYFARLPEAIIYTLTGRFDEAVRIVNMQWALYLPSIYSFVFYDAYVSAVEYNKLFEKELSNYLRRRCQPKPFRWPI